MGDRLNAAAELAAGQKLAVVAASAAALTGGGTAIDELANHSAPPRAAQVRAEEPKAGPIEAPLPVDTAPLSSPPAATQPEPTTAPSTPSPPPPPAPDPADEFTPAGAPPPAPAPAAPSQESFGTAGDGAGGRSSPAGSGEFAP